MKTNKKEIEFNTNEKFPDLYNYFITHTEYKETNEKYKNCKYCENSEKFENKLYCDVKKTTVFTIVDENHTCKYNKLNEMNIKKDESNFREVILNNCSICKYYHEDFDFFTNPRCILHGSIYNPKIIFSVSNNTICDKFERSEIR